MIKFPRGGGTKGAFVAGRVDLEAEVGSACGVLAISVDANVKIDVWLGGEARLDGFFGLVGGAFFKVVVDADEDLVKDW